MDKLNSIETQSNLDAIPLSDQTKFRLNEIKKKAISILKFKKDR